VSRPPWPARQFPPQPQTLRKACLCFGTLILPQSDVGQGVQAKRSEALIADGSRERNPLLKRCTRLRKLALIPQRIAKSEQSVIGGGDGPNLARNGERTFCKGSSRSEIVLLPGQSAEVAQLRRLSQSSTSAPKK
jgi:hypothetical protein